MGASNSRLEEDKGLQLCRTRKKFIKQALNGRCSVAAAHIAYVDELKNLGNALGRFASPDAQVESFTFPSRSATPEPHAFIEKSVSQFSVSSRSPSQYAETTANMSPSPSPQVLRRYNSHHMKFRSMFSQKVEEKPPEPVAVSVSSTTPPCTTPRSTELPEVSFETPAPSETTPWDYFGLFHPIDNHFSSQDKTGFDHGSEFDAEIRDLEEEEGTPKVVDVEQKVSSPQAEEYSESEDEFDRPTSATLVRSFENVNRSGKNDLNGDSPIMTPERRILETKISSSENENKTENFVPSEDPSIKPTENLISEINFANAKSHKSPDLSPLRATSSRFVHSNSVKIAPFTESEVEDKVVPKDFFSSIKDVEQLFLKASESGKEVPRMLEANKFHFRPVFPRKANGSLTSSLLKSCFSCGDDPSEVQQEPPQGSVKYLTWHRTSPSPSASSRNLLGTNSIDDNDALHKNLFEDFCMVSGSHASTLDRLYAWEKKLFDEVKAGQVLRNNFDQKCKLLRHKESRGINTDKTRAVVKDLHSRIRVSIHRINSISKKIEEIRDKELQPQLEELIEGLRRMWELMLECHSHQFLVISTCDTSGGVKIAIMSDSRRQNAIHLETELKSLSSCFTKWIGAQKIYIEAINNWLFKCVSLPQKTAKRRNRRLKPPPIGNYGPPPIYIICGKWLEIIDELPTKGVVDSMKDLAAEVNRFLPHQEKNPGTAGGRSQTTSLAGEDDDQGLNTWRDEGPGFDAFQLSLTGFLGKLNEYAEASVKKFLELQEVIGDAKSKY